MSGKSEQKKGVKNLEENVETEAIASDEIDYDAKIFEIQKELANLEVKKMILRASIGEGEARPLPKTSEAHLLSQIEDLTVSDAISKTAFQMCIRSEDIENLLNDDSDDAKEVNVLLQELVNANVALMDLQKKREQLSIEIIVQQNVYQTAICEHNKFLERGKKEKRELLESNSEIVKLQQKLEQLMQKINILNILIENFIIADAKNVKNNAFYQEMLETHTDPVTEDDVNELAEKYID